MNHPDQLTLDDFRDPERLQRRQHALRSAHPHLVRPAREMYTGRQHEYAIAGVDGLRQALAGQAAISFQVLSAGYGLVDEYEPFLPYEATFNGMGQRELQRYAQGVLHLHQRVQAAVQGYDLVIFLLGDQYLRALDLPLQTQPEHTLLFVAGTTTRSWFPASHHGSLVCLSHDEARRVGGGQVGVKGMVLKRLANTIAAAPPEKRLGILLRLRQEPLALRRLILPNH